MRDVPVRLVVAAVLTVVGLGVLGVAALVGRDDGSSEGTASTTTSAVEESTTVPVVPTTMEVLPDWYRKGNSRFSERGPAPTVSSLPSTSTSSTSSTTTTRPRSTASTGGAVSSSGGD